MFMARYAHPLLLFAITVVLAVGGQFATAALIPINNPSFEADTIPDGQDYGALSVGWSGYNASPYTLDNSGTSPRFPNGGIPDGNQVGATVAPTGSSGSSLYQFLHELDTYEPDTVYTLSGSFGYDATSVASGQANAGGKIELYSGADSWQTPWITIEFGLNELPVGGFTFASAQYTTEETGGPLGGAMLIRIEGFSTATNDGMFCVDNIQLDAKPYVPPMGGDINLDGTVDEIDATIFAVNWGWTGGATWSNGDFNEDGDVDNDDAAIMAANWLAVQEEVAALSNVPEPGTIVLLGLGALSLLLQPRKR